MTLIKRPDPLTLLEHAHKVIDELWGVFEAQQALGLGVYELAEDHRGDTFRAVYAVNVGDAVHVPHAFQKKSKSGIATPQPDVASIEQRLKSVLARYGAGGRS